MKLFKTTLIATALVAAGFVGNAGAANNLTATGDFQVKIVISESCTFSSSTSAGSIDFGSAARSATDDIDQTGTLSVLCTKGTPFNVGLGAGTASGATVSTRQMTGAGGTINYGLYRDAARTGTYNWGNTVGTDTLAGTGTGSAQSLTVYGRVPGDTNLNVAAGTYTDTVVATIYY